MRVVLDTEQSSRRDITTKHDAEGCAALSRAAAPSKNQTRSSSTSRLASVGSFEDVTRGSRGTNGVPLLRLESWRVSYEIDTRSASFFAAASRMKARSIS